MANSSPINKSTTRNITSYPWGLPVSLAALPFIEMWIVHNTGSGLPCAPTKGRVTRDAPHLVAPVNLCNHLSAFWTSLCIFSKKLSCLNVIWVTSVRSITCHPFHLVAFRAGVKLTDATLPRCREKPTTSVRRATTHKRLMCLSSHLINSFTGTQSSSLSLELPYLSLNTVILYL